MDEGNMRKSGLWGKTPGIRVRITVALIIALLLSGLTLYFSRTRGPSAGHDTVLGNTARAVEMISRIRINLLKSADLEKGAVMAMTDEESQALAEQARKSADAVDRDYHELKSLIDAANIDNELDLLKEFGENLNTFREIDRELLSMAVQNSNIKAANLSDTIAAQAMENFERLLASLVDLPTRGHDRAQMARLAYQAIAGAFMIHGLEARHIHEARDKKMDELENLMSLNEKKVRNALHAISGLINRHEKIIYDDTLSAFSNFMKVHQEVVRLSRMNTNIKSLQLSLGRKRKAAARCEEILNSLQETVQNGRSLKATR